MGLLRGSTRAIAFLKIAVLARLLTPEIFGIFGIALLVLAFLEMLTETGINIFLIQENKKLSEYVNTAWIVSVVRGLIIGLILIAFAPLISNFFKSPGSLNILYIMSIVPILRGFINPSIVKYQKNLEFNKEFLLKFTIFFFDAFVAIVLAAITGNASSLVYGLIAGVVLEIIISFAFVKPRPKLSVEVNKVKKIINRGKWITLAGMFDYLFRQGDDIVVGKLINTNSLGIYQMAYKITTLPIQETGEVFNKVTFPIYTKFIDDKKRLRKAFFKVGATISLFVIPFGLILIIFTEELVVILLGNNWLSVIPLIKPLAFFGIFKAIMASANPLFLAAKKQEYVTYYTFVSIFGLFISIFPLISKYQTVGAAWAAVIGAFLSFPVIIYYTYKLLKD